MGTDKKCYPTLLVYSYQMLDVYRLPQQDSNKSNFTANEQVPKVRNNMYDRPWKHLIWRHISSLSFESYDIIAFHVIISYLILQSRPGYSDICWQSHKRSNTANICKRNEFVMRYRIANNIQDTTESCQYLLVVLDVKAIIDGIYMCCSLCTDKIKNSQ